MYVAISGNGNFTGNNVVYEQKQEYALKFKGADYTFSNFVCNNAEISTKKNTVASVAKNTNVDYTKDYIVEDTRDNKYYIVRKLYMRASDGTISTACWMTQNLDLDLATMYAKNSEYSNLYAYNRENNKIVLMGSNNSDTYADTKPGYTNSNIFYASNSGGNSNTQDWTTSYKLENIAYGATPVFPSTPSTGNKMGPDNGIDYHNALAMADPGDIMVGPFDSTNSVIYSAGYSRSTCEADDAYCYQFTNSKYFATEPTGHIVSASAAGNFYNAFAATAASYYYLSDGTNATDSICPKGWGLPIGGANAVNGEYNKLSSAYFPVAGITSQSGTVWKIGDNVPNDIVSLNTLKANSDAMLTETPLSFVRSYGPSANGKSIHFGDSSSYWSATVYTAQNSLITTQTSSALIYSGTSTRSGISGSNVRCVQGI